VRAIARFSKRLNKRSGADHWLREIAPSDQLRQWFDHDPNRWEEFKQRYFQELQTKPEAVRFLLELARKKGGFAQLCPLQAL
jgi:uncharacterized protein YeaO (DUF488 family)